MPRDSGHTVYSFNEVVTRVTRPFKKFGEVQVRGQSIRLFWAIDDANQCWMSSYRGQPLDPVTSDDLLRMLQHERREWDQHQVEEVLGVPRRRTKFENEAMARGWTPPAGWVDPGRG